LNKPATWGRGIAGSVVMLNLLRFREVADYSAHPGLVFATEIDRGKRKRRP
jgi:hypothetical protein